MVTLKLLFMEGKGEGGEELFLELVTSDCLFYSVSSVSVLTVCVCSCVCTFIHTSMGSPQVLLRYN